MENQELLISYANWAVAIVLTIIFFNLFSKKHKNFGKLFAFVLIPVWIILAIVQGIEYIYIQDSYMLLSLIGFSGLLAETLPVLLVFGGITFYFKYRKFKKS